MPQLYRNNASTTLASAVTSNSQTSLVVASGKGALFGTPSAGTPIRVTLDDGTNIEICICTNVTGDTLTVTRGQEGTTAQSSFAIGTKVEARLTAAGLDAKASLDGAAFTGPVQVAGKATGPAWLPSIQAVTSAATVTPNADTDGMVVITAQAVALTLANPTGTPIQGQKLIIRVKDNGTARGISYGTQYRAMGNALPSTTVLSKTLYLGLIFNSTDTKWDLVAVAQEA